MTADASEAIEAAQSVLERHFAALNARDEAALNATLHFPHYRLAGGSLQVWKTPGRYLADFYLRTAKDWDYSTLGACNVIAASQDKVHIDVRFARHRHDGSVIGNYRSLWVFAYLDGRWAAQLRSSFAA